MPATKTDSCGEITSLAPSYSSTMDPLWRLCIFIAVLYDISQRSNACQSGDIRLASGHSHLDGRVEVCFAGNWGTVCDDSWDQNDANVACKQLGFSAQGAEAVPGRGTDPERGYVAGPGDHILDDLACSGDENSLFECLQTSNCDAGEQAGLVCQTDDVLLMLDGRVFRNNSLISLENLGNFDNMSEPLLCVTTDPFCCQTNRSGSWFSPQSNALPASFQNPSELYQSWGDDQTIQLNKPDGTTAAQFQQGLYRCEVADRNGIMQVVYTGLYSDTTGGATVTRMTYEKTSQTILCTSNGGPASTVTWSKDGSLLPLDGPTYQSSQIILDTVSSTYLNTLTFTGPKTESLSGTYACMVENSRGNSSMQLIVTVCVDGAVRLNADSSAPGLEICSNDQWMSLDSTLQISNEESSAIRNFEGRQADNLYTISLSWAAMESIARYEIVCTSSLLTSMVRVGGASTSATVTVAPISGAGSEYSCCVTAYQSAKLFNLVEQTSSECVLVPLERTVSVDLQVGGPASTTRDIPKVTFPSESSSVQQLDPVVTYALGGLSGLLIIAVVLVAVGCFCVVLSKRRDQMTYPKEPRRQRITGNRDFLVDNPIYKTCNSTTSLVNSENGVRSNKLELRSVGGSSSSILNEPEPSASSSKLSAADNPQYGSSSQYQFPPPSHKPPRYVKVNPGEEPTYEIIQNGNADTCKGEKASLPSHGGSATGDPIYSTPSPVLKSKKGETKTLPLYESAMDVPVAMGKDGAYAKLNHESKTSLVPLPSI